MSQALSTCNTITCCNSWNSEDWSYIPLVQHNCKFEQSLNGYNVGIAYNKNKIKKNSDKILTLFLLLFSVG